MLPKNHSTAGGELMADLNHATKSERGSESAALTAGALTSTMYHL
jgi:hypothetical protein